MPKSTEMRELPLGQIIPGRNYRDGAGEIEELVESIREHGLLQPIRVRPTSGGLYQIIAGHRRFAAHRRLGAKTIQAVVALESDEETAVQNLVENLQREDLRPIELAQGVRELISAYDMTIEQMSRALSKSAGQVRTWIRLARLPDSVLNKLQSREAGTHQVQGVAPRLAQPFVSDLPSNEERASNPEAQAKWEERVGTLDRFIDLAVNTKEQTGVHVNAHMADAVARSVKSGHLTVEEAIQRVLEDPKRYSPIATATDLGRETLSDYAAIQMEIIRRVNQLRPEIAVSFSGPERRQLEEGVDTIQAKLSEYRSALAAQKFDELPESGTRAS